MGVFRGVCMKDRLRKELARVTDPFRATDLEFIPKACPLPLVEEILEKHGKSIKHVKLVSATVLVYLIIALPIWRKPRQDEVFRLVCKDLSDMLPDCDYSKQPTHSAICKARRKLGPDVMPDLAGRVLAPIAPRKAPGAWFEGLRLMSLVGTAFDLLDTRQNADFFGYPDPLAVDYSGYAGSKIADYQGYPGEKKVYKTLPQARVVGLVENATRVVAAAEVGPYKIGERSMAIELFDSGKLTPETLLMADSNFAGFEPWSKAMETGAGLLWRVKNDFTFHAKKRLPDGSFLSVTPQLAALEKSGPLKVRVINAASAKNAAEYEDVFDKGNYSLITNLYDFEKHTAKNLVLLFQNNRDATTVFEEMKPELRGNSTTIRSMVPILAVQDIWGILIFHFALRRLMAQGAWDKKKDPKRFNFLEAAEELSRAISPAAAIPASGVGVLDNYLVREIFQHIYEKKLGNEDFDEI